MLLLEEMETLPDGSGGGPPCRGPPGQDGPLGLPGPPGRDGPQDHLDL